MAGTITKNLKLKAVLDDQAFRKQLQELKKELGNVEMGSTGGAAGFDRSAKLINEAAQALRQAAENFKKSGGTSGVGGTSARKRDVEIIVDSVTKNTSNKIKQFFDVERSRYINLKPGQTYDQEMGKTFRRDMDHEKAKAIFKEREQKKEQERGDRALVKSSAKEAKIKADELKKNLSTAKDVMAAMLSKTGMGLPMARQVSQAMSSMAPDTTAGMGSMIRGMGPGLGMAAGITALAGLVVHGIMNNAQRSREYRMGAARESQEVGTSLLEGKGLEGVMLSRSRGDVGAVEGSLAAGFGALNVLNPFSKNFATNPIEAGRQAIREREEGAQQAALAETELARSALSKAKSLRQPRMQAMRGGAVNETQLDTLQMVGALSGFSQEETLNQINASKQFLGKDAASNLPTMQRRMNMTGISVEDQAAVAETFMGARKGTGSGAALTQSFETIRKGVAAGLDVSKSGQFLKLTADYIRSNQGLGQVDTEDIAQRLADAASGFAGGGPVTQTSLQQAAQLQDILTKESTAESGFAGIGNIKALQDIYGKDLDSGKFMAGMNISANATPEDVMKIMGGTKEQAQALLEAKKNVEQSGLRAAGVDPNSALGIALASKDRGVTSEQQLGALSAQGFKAQRPTEATTALIEAGDQQSRDRQSLVSDFKVQQEAFNKGVNLMGLEANNAATLLKIFSDQLQKSVGKFEDTLGVRNKSGR